MRGDNVSFLLLLPGVVLRASSLQLSVLSVQPEAPLGPAGEYAVHHLCCPPVS